MTARTVRVKIPSAEGPLQSTVSATADAGSITTGNETRDGHLAWADFFDVEHHPKWTFESTRIRFVDDEWLIAGTLTIRGASKPVILGMETPGSGRGNTEGSMKAPFSATATIAAATSTSTTTAHPWRWYGAGDKAGIILEIEANLVLLNRPQ